MEDLSKSLSELDAMADELLSKSVSKGKDEDVKPEEISDEFEKDKKPANPNGNVFQRAGKAIKKFCKDLKGVETGKVLCPCAQCVRNAVLAAGEMLGE